MSIVLDFASYPTQWVDHDKTMKPYVWSHRVIDWARQLCMLIILVFFLFGGHAARLENWAFNHTGSLFIAWLLFFGSFALVLKVLFFPFDIASEIIEKRFHLSKQSWPSWLWDKAKALMVGGVIGVLVFAILYLSVRNFGDYWWAVCCTLLVLVSVVLAQLTPVLLIPIFYKLVPMETGPLKERLLDLCKRFGIAVKEVYHLGLGEKTEKGNAAFAGLGRTKRILIGDTIYKKFTAEEVEAVFAHELGHQVHNDLWKGIFVNTVLMFVGFFVTEWLCGQYILSYFNTLLDHPMGIFLFLIVLSIVQMPLGVFGLAYTRHSEKAADHFATKKIGMGGQLANALEKLTLQNYGLFRPHPFIEFFTYSHPAPWRRILGLRAG
ncbi:MAG: M48 family metallopeptidase [Deltaproteobacteria bacterium]|nr:M48 family metallopeptidase [Deltaproteobacteria bacterium]